MIRKREWLLGFYCDFHFVTSKRLIFLVAVVGLVVGESFMEQTITIDRWIIFC